MPRNSSGTYSLPVAAFVPGGLIKSADNNSNFFDIATALTQSLATTGVSTMTGPIKAAAGAVNAPSVTFGGSLTTGFYLSGTNQIGWTANGVQGAAFNADTSVTWAGGATWGGTISAAKGTVPIGAEMDFAGSVAPAGWLFEFGQLVSTTTYAALFAVISTTYGSGAGTFGIPDKRGRTTFGADNMGGSAANRLTLSNSGIDGETLGAVGGNPNFTIAQSALPNVSPTITVTDLGHQHTVSSPLQGASSAAPDSGFATGQGTTFTSSKNTTGITASLASINGGVSQTVINLPPPAIVTNKIIYAGV